MTVNVARDTSQRGEERRGEERRGGKIEEEGGKKRKQKRARERGEDEREERRERRERIERRDEREERRGERGEERREKREEREREKKEDSQREQTSKPIYIIFFKYFLQKFCKTVREVQSSIAILHLSLVIQCLIFIFHSFCSYPKFAKVNPSSPVNSGPFRLFRLFGSTTSENPQKLEK